MECIVKYNPTTDLAAVEPFGYVNLRECVEKGEVPTSISNTELDYNGIDNPSDIYGKPHDVFEAYRMNDYVKSNGKAPKTDE